MKDSFVIHQLPFVSPSTIAIAITLQHRIASIVSLNSIDVGCINMNLSISICFVFILHLFQKFPFTACKQAHISRYLCASIVQCPFANIYLCFNNFISFSYQFPPHILVSWIPLFRICHDRTFQMYTKIGCITKSNTITSVFIFK